MASDHSMTTRCPRCGQPMYELDRSMYCPNEDNHPGGVVLFHDGLLLESGLAPRSIMTPSPKNEGAKP